MKNSPPFTHTSFSCHVSLGGEEEKRARYHSMDSMLSSLSSFIPVLPSSTCLLVTLCSCPLIPPSSKVSLSSIFFQLATIQLWLWDLTPNHKLPVMKGIACIKTRAVARMWWVLYYHGEQNLRISKEGAWTVILAVRIFFLLLLFDYHLAHLPNNMSYHYKHSPYLGLQKAAGLCHMQK